MRHASEDWRDPRHVDPGGVRATSAGAEAPGLEHHRDRRRGGLPPGHGLQVAEGGRPTTGPAGGPVGAGDRRAVGKAHRPVDRSAVEAAGHECLRDRLGRGVHGLLPERGAPRPGPARPPVPGGSPGVGPDRDRAGRGVPVRLLGLLRAGSGLRDRRHLVVLRAGALLEPAPVLVVHHLGRPGAHDGGPRPGVRAGRRRAQGCPHRSDGGARHLTGEAIRPPSPDDRLRRPPSGRGQGLPGPGRQAQRLCFTLRLLGRFR